jgi:hypothetical protein
MVSEFKNTPDEQLMEKVRAGNEEAFYILVKRNATGISEPLQRYVYVYPFRIVTVTLWSFCLRGRSSPIGTDFAESLLWAIR